jgi:hypothetical protein
METPTKEVSCPNCPSQDMSPHVVCPSSSTTSRHHPSYPLRPCKGPISYLISLPHYTSLSLPLWPTPMPTTGLLPHLIVTHSPLVCPSFTWINSYITSYPSTNGLFMALMMDAVCTSEMSNYSNKTTWRYISEGSNFHTCHHENLKSHDVNQGAFPVEVKTAKCKCIKQICIICSWCRTFLPSLRLWWVPSRILQASHPSPGLANFFESAWPNCR